MPIRVAAWRPAFGFISPSRSIPTSSNGSWPTWCPHLESACKGQKKRERISGRRDSLPVCWFLKSNYCVSSATTSPPLGVRRAYHVLGLMVGERLLTLPSPMATFIAAWAVVANRQSHWLVAPVEVGSLG